MSAPSAIVSAVEDALAGSGLFLTDIPITPARLDALVKTRKGLASS